MEMNTFSLSLPVMQSKSLPLHSGGGKVAAGFAGLLAMLQQLPGFSPEAAVAFSQQAGSKEQAGALPKLLAALLPQMLPQSQPDGNKSPLFQENGGTGDAAFWLPAVFLGMPFLLPSVAEGDANGKAQAGGLPVSLENALQAAAATEAGAGKQLSEILLAAAQQAASGVKPGTENLLPEPVTALLQTVSALEPGAEKPLPEALSAEQKAVLSEKPAAQAKSAPEKAPLAYLQLNDKTIVDLPVYRLNKSELSTTVQGPPALSYQAFPDRHALAGAAARFADSPLGRAAVVEQVLEKMVFRKEPEGDSTLSLRLKPGALGEVQVSLRLEDGRLMARIMTENLYVKEVLDAALGQLKQRLEAQQIQVSELTVTVGSQQDFRQDKSFRPFWQQTENFGKRPALATVAAEKGGGLPGSLRQGLVDVRV